VCPKYFRLVQVQQISILTQVPHLDLQT
jgi:hypothetical protein